MAPHTQEVPGYFVWEAPGQSFFIHLNLNVVDRMGAEVARGFGLVPKRGAEVGGVLFGTVETGERTIVRVEDFEPVATAYRRGPSFFLSDEERIVMAAVAGQTEDDLTPVGYYRSHTREGAMSLGAEDLELIERHFRGPHHIALLVRPFATKVSVAGFFVREDGKFPEATPREFPFRRRELAGEEAPARRPLGERPPRARGTRGDESLSLTAQLEAASPEEDPPSPPPEATPRATVPLAGSPPPERRPVRTPKSPWAWLPLCFIFLILGMALGFQTALTFAPELRDRTGADAFQLNLTAGQNGDSLTVRWDRDSPAVLAAQQGVLEIEDGELSKRIPLDPAHLHDGTVIYQHSSSAVQFRLVLSIGAQVTVNEAVEWRQSPP